MANRINSVILIDDNKYDNFFHERVIRNTNIADKIVQMQSAFDALKYLEQKASDKDNEIDLIFLDLNMPGMNGWEFLQHYTKFNGIFKNLKVVALTTSENPDILDKAKQYNNLSGVVVKPLTKDIVKHIVDDFKGPLPEFGLF